MMPLVFMALERESGGLVEQAGAHVVYTGVGKVNAAYALMKYITANPGEIPLVINMGTAGSGTFDTGTVVAARQFVQRDMDVTGLGFKHGETPFERHPLLIEFAPVFDGLPHGICGSGDSFLQGAPPIECDIIDMEAYALAKICYLQSLPFACVKYITDGADKTAHLDWQANTILATRKFAEIVNSMHKIPA